MSLASSLRLLTLPLFLAAACGGDDDGGGGFDAGDEADAAAPDAGPDIAALCADYCDAIMENCTANLEQYGTMDQCLQSCAGFSPGLPDAESGNSIACRTYHGGDPAATTPDLHCRHAGPGGDGTCGDNCAGFCSIVMDSCTGDNEQYASLAACMDDCDSFSDTEDYDTSDQSSDTLACRLYHATVASADPGGHCAHVVSDSSICVD